MIKRMFIVAGITGSLALLALACQPQTPSANSTAAAVSATNPQIYQVKGVVNELVSDKLKIKITHEAIPGYMEAMTMMLDVRDRRELEGLQVGDTISFRMLVTETDGWIDQLKKLDVARVATVVSNEAVNFRRVREVEPLAVGDKMPDYTFTNALGRVVRISDFKGQALAFTFIFTRCPYPIYCPKLSMNFSETQAKLKGLSGGPTNWHLMSITIDPEYDTPARLKSYAGRYQADSEKWDFVTGDWVDITAIGEQFGLQFWRPKPTDPISHNMRTVVVDAAGRVQWVSVESDWKNSPLVDQIVKAAQVAPTN